jgi:hypothetical protein
MQIEIEKNNHHKIRYCTNKKPNKKFNRVVGSGKMCRRDACAELQAALPSLKLNYMSR